MIFGRNTNKSYDFRGDFRGDFRADLLDILMFQGLPASLLPSYPAAWLVKIFARNLELALPVKDIILIC